LSEHILPPPPSGDMADILSGRSDHRCFAPLSGGQSIQLAKHLAEQIMALQAAVENLRNELTQTNDGVTVVRHGLSFTEASVLTMQDGLANTDLVLDRTRKEQARATAHASQLQVTLEEATETCAALREGQRLIGTRLEVQDREFAHAKASILDLQEGLDRNEAKDESERGENERQLLRLWASNEQVTNEQKEQREAQRAAASFAQGLCDGQLRSDALLQIMEHRVADTQRSLKKASMKLEDASSRGLKLHEDHEGTKVQVGASKGDLVMTSAKVDKFCILADATASDVATAKDLLNRMREAMEAHGGRIHIAEAEALRLSQANDEMHRAMRAMQVQLEEAVYVAQAVRAGLKETNSIILPNITMDTQAAAALGVLSTLGQDQQFSSSRAPPSRGGGGTTGGSRPVSRSRGSGVLGSARKNHAMSPPVPPQASQSSRYCDPLSNSLGGCSGPLGALSGVLAGGGSSQQRDDF